MCEINNNQRRCESKKNFPHRKQPFLHTQTMADDNFDLYGEDDNFGGGTDELYGTTYDNDSSAIESSNNNNNGNSNNNNNYGNNNGDEELVDFEQMMQDAGGSRDGRRGSSATSDSAGQHQFHNPGRLPNHGLPPNPMGQPVSGQRALYVNELTWWTTDEELRLLVSDAGVGDQLGVKDLVFQEHKINGKSRGLVYMEFKSSAAAKTIKELLDKMEIHGETPCRRICGPRRTGEFV
ncbi:hypothetical protein BC829DRAFT_123047 [Chytridium lagenaria]|nr:hypothetical protein BC829DRAFT_123047 [Chytridium lagenaria]